MASIGSYAFYQCKTLKKIVFNGNAPQFENDTFWQVNATAYYPAGDKTWTKEKRKQYGGKKKWVEQYRSPKVTLKSMTTPKKGWIKVTWKAAKGIFGYQLEVSESKDFKTGKQKKSKLSAKEKDVTMSGLKSKKTYYARMRTYKKDGSKTYYGEWSAVKSVKVK